MKNITISLPDVLNQEYSIHIGEHLLSKIGNLIDVSSYSKIAIITDENVKSKLEELKKNFMKRPLEIILEPGEKSKNVKSLEIIWQKLAGSKFDRKSLVINLGGGVICDIGGFAASTYMRGVDFINIPTTLLAQVDASVGGKTAIDFFGVKNLIGTFQQPKSVIIDVETLKTLPKKEFLSGFAEIIKHGLIADKKYFDKVSAKKPTDYSSEELIDIVSGSCEIKKRVVVNDVSEKGLRKILNFGHTIGHAVESLSLETKEPLTHGEAISIGMNAEAKLSQMKGYLSDNDLILVEQGFENAGLPIKTNLDTTGVWDKINIDKKNESGQIKWTLLKQLGEAVYDQDVADETVAQAIETIK